MKLFKYVKVLHNGSYHWVVVININCTKLKTNYCNSLFHGRIKGHVKRQICNMCKFFEEELSLNFRACQQQWNGVDCRIFIVANAFHLLSGLNLSVKRISEDQIRPHLLTCLKPENFKEILSSEGREKVVHCQEKKRLNVICNCRFPWEWCQIKSKV